MICDLQAIAPLTDAAKRIQEAEESGKTLLEVCLIHMRYWPNMRSICLMLAKSVFFFFALLRSKTKSMSLKIQKRVGQYRQEHQIQTCFAVCIKAVNFRLQLFWIIFWPDWKFFRTWSAWIKLLWRHFYWVKKRAELTANDYMQEWKTESQVNKWKH